MNFFVELGQLRFQLSIIELFNLVYVDWSELPHVWEQLNEQTIVVGFLLRLQKILCFLNNSEGIDEILQILCKYQVLDLELHIQGVWLHCFLNKLLFARFSKLLTLFSLSFNYFSTDDFSSLTVWNPRFGFYILLIWLSITDVILEEIEVTGDSLFICVYQVLSDRTLKILASTWTVHFSELLNHLPIVQLAQIILVAPKIVFICCLKTCVVLLCPYECQAFD